VGYSEIEGSEMKTGFCWNSKRWILFMYGSKIRTCKCPPIGSCCDECGYYEHREETKYFKTKYGFINKT